MGGSTAAVGCGGAGCGIFFYATTFCTVNVAIDTFASFAQNIDNILFTLSLVNIYIVVFVYHLYRMIPFQCEMLRGE